MKKRVGLYLHIPYCARKCLYCDFCSYPGRMSTAGQYTERVLSEMKEKRGDYLVSTVFIGGGTPSLMPPPLMKKMLDGLRENFELEEGAEFSCEMNPGCVSDRFLEVMKEAGVNRVSLGVQAMQDRLLIALGRIHTAAQVPATLEKLRRFGFDNINADVMYELPGQTAKDLAETLESLLPSGITHLSCYALIPEEGTPLGDRILSGQIKKPPEEECAEMDRVIREKTRKYGFERYEISNWALPGRECRHNRDCWLRREYLGLGCAAAGMLNNTRYRNPDGLDDYLRGAPPEVLPVSAEEARFESLMLGLRMTRGVSEEEFRLMHGMSLREAFGERLLQPVRQGLAVYENGVYRLTERGLDTQNAVLLSLMD